MIIIIITYNALIALDCADHLIPDKHFRTFYLPKNSINSFHRFDELEKNLTISGRIESMLLILIQTQPSGHLPDSMNVRNMGRKLHIHFVL